MPEGDTIFRAAATLHRALAGRVVTRFETAYAHLAVVDDQERLAGRRVEAVTSAGKHVLMRFERNLVLRTHMRMNGSWHLYHPGEPWRVPRAAMRVLVATDEWLAIAFNVPVAEFLAGDHLAQRALVSLGPDLLGPTFDEPEAIRRIQARGSEPIAEALLNQRLVAGIGNVYKSETLFAARIHPNTPAGTLDAPTLAMLLGHARRLLQANVKPTSPGAIVTYGGLRRETGREGFGNGLWVYGRRGLPCRTCGTPIEMKKTGYDVRSTYWCPQCQKCQKSQIAD